MGKWSWPGASGQGGSWHQMASGGRAPVGTSKATQKPTWHLGPQSLRLCSHGQKKLVTVNNLGEAEGFEPHWSFGHTRARTYSRVTSPPDNPLSPEPRSSIVLQPHSQEEAGGSSKPRAKWMLSSYPTCRATRAVQDLTSTIEHPAG